METEYQLIVYLEFLNRIKYTLMQKSKQQIKKRRCSFTDSSVELDFMSTKKKRLFDTVYLIEKLIFLEQTSRAQRWWQQHFLTFRSLLDLTI